MTTLLYIRTEAMPDSGTAEDSLAESRVIESFKFGFVDADNRVHTFWTDTKEVNLPKNVKRVQASSAFDLIDFIGQQRAFSKEAFGPEARVKGVCAHIRKELLEIEDNPTDVFEWIDVVLLALDGAWRSGASEQQIVRALERKLHINKSRVWPDWRKLGDDQAIEHKHEQDKHE